MFYAKWCPEKVEREIKNIILTLTLGAAALNLT